MRFGLSAFFTFEQADCHKNQAHDADAEVTREKEQVVGGAVQVGGEGEAFHKLCDGGAGLAEEQDYADGEKLL